MTGRAVVFVAGRDPRDEVSGGHSAYVRSYARAALRAGFQPHLFCAARDGRVEATDFGVVHRVASPVRPFRQTVAGLHAPWVVRAIRRWVAGAGAGEGMAAIPGAAGGGPVLLHGFGVWGVIAVRAARRLGERGVPAVAVVGSYTTYEEESRAKVRGAGAGAYGWRQGLALRAEHLWIRLAVERWEREAYVGAACVPLNYDSVRRLVAAKYGAAARCVRLAYTCEAAFLGPAGGQSAVAGDAGLELDGAGGDAAGAPRPPLLVAVSRHDTRKGVDVLLRALAALRGAGVPLRAYLVGGGPLLDIHRRLAARLGLDGMVTITGAVPDIHPYLERADLYALPSREEQSGSLALLEALRAGKATVASAVDGIVEDVTDGVDALLVPPGDVPALAAALQRLLADASLRLHLAAGARATFAVRFSPDVVADDLRALYGRFGFEPPPVTGDAGSL